MDAVAERFRADLDRLHCGGWLGIAVSGGPDSLALLLLAAAVRPGSIEAATVDHGLRPESRAEADAVAAVCARLGVPHAVLPVTVERGASLQAQAREARYAALAKWAHERRLDAVLTGHHADDQAETLLMRLARGSGLSGLSGVRVSQELASPDGSEVRVLRPLLGWRKVELERIVLDAGLHAADDPANRDPRHDRTRARELLNSASWLDATPVAASATHLAEAEEALAFSVAMLAAERVRSPEDGALAIEAADLPRELQRRLLLEGFEHLGRAAPRGPDLDRALTQLREGGTCTLAGLRLSGGATWRIAPAPPRRSGQ